MATPEKLLENRILDWLNSLADCFAFKVNTTGIYDAKRKVWRKINGKHIHRGTCDIFGVIDKQFFGIEVKAGYNKPSPDQTKFMERIKLANGVTFWTNDFEKCKSTFIKHFPKSRHKDELLFSEIL